MVTSLCPVSFSLPSTLHVPSHNSGHSFSPNHTGNEPEDQRIHVSNSAVTAACVDALAFREYTGQRRTLFPAWD